MNYEFLFVFDWFFCKALATLKTTKGYALADILTELHRYVHKSKIKKFLIY